MKAQRSARAFTYAAGIRLADANIACDALGHANDLVFLSHANALSPRDRLKELGRRELLTTEQTLRMLGAAAPTLRVRALPAAFGRPFTLGPCRIELLSSGHLPGAAALLCESERRRTMYLGAFCPEPLLDGVEPFLVRRADALCIDAALAASEFVIPPRQQVRVELQGFVEQSLAEGARVVLLISAFGATTTVAAGLAKAGVRLRAHRRLAAVLARLHLVCESVPPVARFAGKLGASEVLLWPAEARNAADLAELGDVRLGFVSGLAADPMLLTSMRIHRGFALSNLPGLAEILEVIGTSGATEIALFNDPSGTVATRLGARGLDAYVVGPPRQMSLPTAR
jgi:hypothetical protein